MPEFGWTGTWKRLTGRSNKVLFIYLVHLGGEFQITFDGNEISRFVRVQACWHSGVAECQKNHPPTIFDRVDDERGVVFPRTYQAR